MASIRAERYPLPLLRLRCGEPNGGCRHAPASVATGFPRDEEALKMQSTLVLATWTFLAGAGIPLIGVFNSGMARTTGNPFTATAVMFAVACLVAFAISVPLYGVTGLARIPSAPFTSYAAGLFIGFYALSATVIIPRFGTGNFIVFILIAQLVTAAVIDQFGLFGMARQPLNALKLGGLTLIVVGIAVMQVAGRGYRPPV